MRICLTILLIQFNVFVFAQKPDAKILTKALTEFDKALVSKDSVQLKRLLNNDLYYGHSNGWVQQKKDVIADLYNGKLTYKAINPQPVNMRVEGNVASVNMRADVDVELDGKPLQLKLSVLQVWIWTNKHWELFARQSVKV